MKNSRDFEILKKIIEYCKEIDEANAQFGNTVETFKKNSVYKNAVAMCVLQIGELSKFLSEEFKEKYNQMPWRDIVAMRNVAAHRYGSIDVDILWDTVIHDIPSLKEYCETILK